MWPNWVEKIFKPLFLHWLEAELGREPKVFFDFEIETGIKWPEYLAQSISGSAVIVPLWTKNYFNSKWCTTEFSHMVERQKQIEVLTQLIPEVIIPLVIHDGDDFPEEVYCTQRLNISKYTNVITKEMGETHEKLSLALCEWMPDLAKRIVNAPPRDPKWIEIANEQFVKDYYKPCTKQTNVPRA